METPKNKSDYRTTRQPTPRLSERKKKLFITNNESNGNILKEEDDLQGISPLDAKKQGTPKSKKSIELLLTRKSGRKMSSVSFLSGDSESDCDKQSNPSPTRRSLRLSEKNISPGNKENQSFANADEQQLPQLFNSSMSLQSLNSPRTPREVTIMKETLPVEDIELPDTPVSNKTQKRQLSSPQNGGKSPRRKAPKVVSPIGTVSISTKAFYSVPKSPRIETIKPIVVNRQPSVKVSPKARKSMGSISSNINRGVRHGIRKPQFQKPQNPINLDIILNNLRNEKLKKLITSKRQEREQIEKIHNIFRQAENPIEMARPLSVISNDEDRNNNNEVPSDKNETNLKTGMDLDLDLGSDFSDIDYDSDGFDESIDNGNNIIVDKEEVIPLITHQINDDVPEEKTECEQPKRKFFKSKRTNVMEVRITDNIRASVCNGKIQLVEEKKRKRPKRRPTITYEFSDEQATVDAILKNLDDTAFGDLTLPSGEDNENPSKDTDQVDENGENLQQLEAFTTDFLSDIQLEDSTDYADFRKRLPYKTNDPNIIEQQHLLLDFLISNNICTEENFTIFIADPDNHRDEAAGILDNLVVVLNEEQMKFRNRLPYNTTDPKIIEQQQNFLFFLMKNDICTEENFDIFIANYDKRRAEAEAIIAEIEAKENLRCLTPNSEMTNIEFETQSSRDSNTPDNLIINEEMIEIPALGKDEIPPNNTLVNIPLILDENNAPENVVTVPEENMQKEKYFPIFNSDHRAKILPSQPTTRRTGRAWQGGFGTSQLQIDAGQKQFGPIQCKQCGLLYTMHEPEEEKLHREYHASLHILRFKGWIDEDIVAIFPEWGPDGRIIRLSNMSHIKRRERLLEILRIVDKELGFSSYILPSIYIAYLAVRKSQIVGLCLVQPLKEANKYLCIDGVDCCTQETFEAKCGISRIWVSPLHRRLHIASKLLNSVQLNTIVGEEIPLDKIAFSAPTEMGRKFAQKITRTENFLVY